MRITCTIDRLEGSIAVLKTDKGEEVLWPQKNLPENIHEGSVVKFHITGDDEEEKEKKELAKEILNEILEGQE